MLLAPPVIFVSPSQLKLLVDHRHMHKSVFRLSQVSKKSVKNVCEHEMWRPARIRGGSSTQDFNTMQDVDTTDQLLTPASVEPMDIDAGVQLSNSNKSNFNMVILYPCETRAKPQT